MRSRPLAERFWEKVDKNGPVHPVLGTRCWVWTAGCNAKGYGTIGAGKPRHSMLAHRVSWELNVGLIPERLGVLHHCDNPPCVRPDHLFPGTHRDNAIDMFAKGRGSQFERSKTQCLRGHAYDDANTHITAEGYRRCRACRREDARRTEDRKPRNQANREFRARWKANDPEGFREYERARAARLKAKNPEKFLQRQRAYSRASYNRNIERNRLVAREKARVIRARRKQA